MIGKPIPTNELEKLLIREAEKDKFVKQMEDELMAIKPGECLLYESQPQAPLWVSIGLALLIDRVKGLKMIKEENRAYVYRDK